MDLKRAEMMARDLMKYHLPGWTFAWARGLRTAGRCWHGRKLITLSQPLTFAREEKNVIDTILHEIAHGLSDYAEGHGAKWRGILISIGGTGERCWRDRVTAAQLPPRFHMSCRKCGATRTQYTNPHGRNADGFYCKCGAIMRGRRLSALERRALGLDK